MVLASADSATELDKLADLADKVMEVATPTIAATSDNSEVKQLRQEVAHLTELVASLNTHARHRSRSRSKPRRSDSPTPQLPPQEGTMRLGKRDGQALAATGVTGQRSSRLFYVSD